MSPFLPLRSGLCVGSLALALGCAPTYGPHGATESVLKLSRVVLYRNGVAYFERYGVVDGDRLSIKVRKDQINDLLKSLTVIDRASGKTMSVSIPLDPQAWQRAALAMLLPGRGRLAEVLDALRGTEVVAETATRRVQGRILMVERIPPADEDKPTAEDHKLTLLDGDTLEIVKLSQVSALRLLDGDLNMQLERHLDASAGEGMFQQVDVVVHFATSGHHDLALSYVAEAPMWKPSYRVVLAEDGSGQALLQSWAVVSNTSGENWNDVHLALTSGAPLAFRYDLHTPEAVPRPDLTQTGVAKHAEVSVGEISFAGAPAAEAAPAPAPAPPMAAQKLDADSVDDALMARDEVAASAPKKGMASQAELQRRQSSVRLNHPAADIAALAQQQPMAASTRQVAGLTRFDIADSVSLPDGSASMVQLINQRVPGEQTFLYKPGGSGSGYEYNPYRVVRFQNVTDFVLEPGPISIYAGGSFVGEGLSEAIASHDRATIPFAADPAIIVHSASNHSNAGLTLTRIVRGLLEVRSFERVITTWRVESRAEAQSRRVLVRQPRAAADFALHEPPADTEVLPDAYLLPVVLAANRTSASLEVIEQRPADITLAILDPAAPALLVQLLAANDLPEATRKALAPIVELRQAIGRIDSEVEGLTAQQTQLDERVNEERQNLWAIQKDPRAESLRKRLRERLEQLTQQAAELGRRIVELTSQRVEKKIALEDQVRDLDLTASSQPPVSAPVR